MKVFIDVEEWFPVYSIETEEGLHPETLEEYRKMFGDKYCVEVPDCKVKEIKGLIQKFKDMQIYLKRLLDDDSPIIYLE